MPKPNKTINIADLPISFRGKQTKNGRFIQTGTPPIGGRYNKIANTTGLTRLGNEFLYNGITPVINGEKRRRFVDNTVGKVINYVNNYERKDGPYFPFNLMYDKDDANYYDEDGVQGIYINRKFAAGGSNNLVPNVVRGGQAIPIGNNLYYMSGRKHNQGGIDIGKNDKTGIEVEGDEVVQTKNNELKVFSAQKFLGGQSPAELVIKGVNPDKVFNAQERFKDKNRINDDGTKYEKGGKVYQVPDEYKRQIAESGSIVIGGYPTIAGNRTYGFVKGLAKVSRFGRTATNLINLGRQKVYDLANKIDNTWVNQGIKEVYRTTIGKHGNNLPRTIDYLNNRKQEKFGGKNMIVSISGNVKNGLIHSPSSTGGGDKRKYKIGGFRRIVSADSLKADRDWYDRQTNKIRYLTDLRNSTRDVVAPTGYKVTDVHRTNEPGRYSLAITMPEQTNIDASIPLNNLPPSNIPRSEEYIEGLIRNDHRNNVGSDRSNYTRGYDGRVYYKSWDTGKSGEVKYGTNEYYSDGYRNNALENARPQYYAERRLPLFKDGEAIKAGLVRAGWSHGDGDNNVGITIPSIPDDYGKNRTKTSASTSATPRRGSMSATVKQSTINNSTPPTATYNRNLTIPAANPGTLKFTPISKEQIAAYNKDDKFGYGNFKLNNAEDYISLAGNIGGALAGFLASRKAIENMKDPAAPMLVSGTKLKTKYNINPQLDKIREDKFEAYRDIDDNTASSRVSLARKQRVRNLAGQASNQLYGQKENIETQLINQDRTQQQQTKQFNAAQYNQYMDRLNQFRNTIAEMKLSNTNNFITGLNAGLQDFIGRRDNRRNFRNTLAAIQARNPNVDSRILRDAGFDFDVMRYGRRR